MRPSDAHEFRVLSVATGEDSGWSQAMRSMALPLAGDLVGHTLDWFVKQLDDNGSTEQILCGAAGSEFVMTDLQIARNIAEDNGWTMDQLVYISENFPGLAARIARSAPQCVNIRDKHSGDTLFHHLARERRVDEITNWLDNGASITPTRNNEGQTAVAVAVGRYETGIAQALWRRLASLNYITAALVAEELKLLPRISPELVRPFLLDIEATVTQTETTFRTKLTRSAEAIGLGMPTLPKDTSSSAIPEVWAKLLPSDQPEQLVASKVVLLPYILGNAEDSCFHAIVEKCDASVFESKILELLVQCKWSENVYPKWRLLVVGYLMSLGLATTAMISSAAQSRDGSAVSRQVDALQGACGVVEAIILCHKIYQIVKLMIPSPSLFSPSAPCYPLCCWCLCCRRRS